LRRVFVSDAAAAILGYPIDELAGQPTLSAIAREEHVKIDGLRATRSTGVRSSGTAESIVVRKSGERVPVEVAWSPVAIDGTIDTITFLRDISARREMEDALVRSEARFRRLIEAAPDAIAVLSDDVLVFANPQLARLLGVDEAERVIGLHTKDFVHPDDVPLVMNRIRTMLDGNQLLPPADVRLRKQPDAWITLEFSSIAIEFEGKPAVLGFARDASPRQAMQARLVENDRVTNLGTLAAGVAHEINNPLAYASLNVGFLARELATLPIPSEQRDKLNVMLETVHEAHERIAAVVRDLRGLAGAGPQVGSVDVARVVDSTLDLVRAGLTHRARLVREIASVPPVVGDFARLGQVLLNLVLNASQAFDRDDADVNEVHVRTCLGAGAYVVIEVRDNGRGVPAELAGRIFEPFFTTKPPGLGTGMGLCISKSIVTSLGGEITFESKLGAGSCFRVTVPVADHDALLRSRGARG
jgi:PAS domain S-box-containing protein